MATIFNTKTCLITFMLLIICQNGYGNQPICGPSLDLVLDNICENGFNKKFKKSMEWNGADTDSTEDNNKLPLNAARFPLFLAKIHGGQVDTLAKTRRRRHGVYDECCLKPCSYNELLSYCN